MDILWKKNTRLIISYNTNTKTLGDFHKGGNSYTKSPSYWLKVKEKLKKKLKEKEKNNIYKSNKHFFITKTDIQDNVTFQPTDFLIQIWPFNPLIF